MEHSFLYFFKAILSIRLVGSGKFFRVFSFFFCFCVFCEIGFLGLILGYGKILVLSADLYRHEESDGDDELKAEFLCPFCAEDFDVVGLCCHIDEDHPVEAKNGVLVFIFVFTSLSLETIWFFQLWVVFFLLNVFVFKEI